jgi:hypothetical protein
MAKYYSIKNIKGLPQILALEFNKNVPMCLMFMRLQEYSEGIKGVRDIVHDPMDVMYLYWKKFKKIYPKAGFGGFNLRGDVMNDLISNLYIHHYPLSKLEKKLIDKLVVISKNFKDNNYFVISWEKNDKATKKHEILHALYYLNSMYRETVNKILANAKLARAKKTLKKWGYRFGGRHGAWILNDEINAYAMTDTKKTIKQLHLTKDTIKQLKKAMKEHLPK